MTIKEKVIRSQNELKGMNYKELYKWFHDNSSFKAYPGARFNKFKKALKLVNIDYNQLKASYYNGLL